MFIFYRCHCSSAVVTDVKYGCDAKNLGHICKIENFACREINERTFSNPHPWPLVGSPQDTSGDDILQYIYSVCLSLRVPSSDLMLEWIMMLMLSQFGVPNYCVIWGWYRNKDDLLLVNGQSHRSCLKYPEYLGGHLCWYMPIFADQSDPELHFIFTITYKCR